VGVVSSDCSRGLRQKLPPFEGFVLSSHLENVRVYKNFFICDVLKNQSWGQKVSPILF
jgi:hypothetical protein